MKVITTILGPIGLLSIFYLGLLFSNLSRRLGAVTKMANRYLWFRLANFFVVLAVFSQVLRGIATLAADEALPFLLADWFALVSFHIPMAVGVTIDLLLVLDDWRWIFKEKI